MNFDNIKHLIVIVLMVLLAVFIPDYYGTTGWLIVMAVIGILFVFNLSIRKNPNFKDYFIGKFNFLTNKYSMEMEFDLSQPLLIEKMKEVLISSGFKLMHVDEQKGIISASSSISWYSWGENIYIEMDADNDKTSLKLTSACLLQIYDWGKNKRNLQKISREFEKSLTI
mgnify:FL=1